jgi:hypothetical protein
VNNYYYQLIDGGGRGNDRNQFYYYIKWEKKSPPICLTNFTYVAMNDTCYQDVLEQGQQDGCASLSSDPECRLKEETADGVRTYQNYSPTNLTPLATCRTVSGMIQSFNVCNDWWQKDRTYLCQTSSSYDFSAVKERTKNISNTVTNNTGSVSYQDKTPNANGGWNYDANTVSLDTTEGRSTCTQACKTRKPATNTQASLSGNAAQSNVSTSSWEFSYKTCRNAACPLAPNEEILIDCQCVNEFADAAAIMETMNQAGKDVICSNGVRQ